jgi:hypothetical protein
MKKYIKYKLFVAVAFLALITVSCDENTDPDPIISTEDYPIATFQASATTVNEKDGTFTVKITTDKMLTRGITFSAEQTGGTAVLHEDYDIIDATVAPFTKEATLVVKFYDDVLPEAAKTLQLKITTPSLANRYFLNPATVFPSYNITINNYVGSELNISFAWPGTNDYDMVTWNATTTPPVGWGDHGATTANPETDNSIHLADPVGTYYVNIMEWDYGVKFNYTFTIAVAGLAPQVITGTFDGTNVSQYTNDKWTKWGGSYDSFRVLKVVNDGTKFVVTKL